MRENMVSEPPFAPCHLRLTEEAVHDRPAMSLSFGVSGQCLAVT